jgi:hypothetical protein
MRMRYIAASAALLGLWAFGAKASNIERNWALHASASQSSTALGADASRAVDGNTNGDWNTGSVTHTNQEIDPFWEVDLGAAHYIDEIRIWNRTDCCAERLNNYIVAFTNSKAGFQHRDLASTLGENSTPHPATAVFWKAQFFQGGDINPISHTRMARNTFKISGDDCNNDTQLSQRGCLARWVRVQLAGTGILSLAEVQVIEKETLHGPARMDQAITWVPSEIIVNGDGAALTRDDQNLLHFYRGASGRLYYALDLTPIGEIPGTPDVNRDAPSATISTAEQKVYVAVHARHDLLSVMSADISTGQLSAPDWKRVGQTQSAPAVISGCNHVVVAWLDRGEIKSVSRTVGTNTLWGTTQSVAGGIRTPPSLAVDNHGNLGMSFLDSTGGIQFTHADCTQFAPVWSAPVKLVGSSFGDRANLAAYGPHFLMATVGGDSRGYFATQITGLGGQQSWEGFEPLVSASAGTPGPLLAEAPRILVMSGAFVVGARLQQTKESVYWIKYPNHTSAGDRWMGQQVIGGAGTAAIAPLMVSFGQSAVPGTLGAPAELFATTLGINDHKIYGINLGRFIANDVIRRELQLRVSGMRNIDPQPDRDLDVSIAQNLFEQMVALLAMPNTARDVVVRQQCGDDRRKTPTSLELDREYGSGQARQSACPYEVLESTERYSADTLIHEWLHIATVAERITSAFNFTDVFQFDGSSMSPASSGMKACSVTNTVCGGDACELAGDNHGIGLASTRDFDPSETTLRRWDNTWVCVSSGGPDGRRYQGGLRWYDVGTDDHAFIHMVIAYRWYGDDLREWIAADQQRGNGQLQQRYNWIRDHFYDGVQFNGRASYANMQWSSDRSLGFFGAPFK